MSKGKLAVLLLILCAVIAIVPLVMYGSSAEFGGSDDAGSEAISELVDEDVEPWFNPIIESALDMEQIGRAHV